jgi:hypothetical protein
MAAQLRPFSRNQTTSMNHFIRSLLLLACSLFMTGRTLTAQQPGNNVEGNEFKGVFKGISTGKMRQQGAKRPISLWTIELARLTEPVSRLSGE